jgi:predicted nucleic acid-binding protein
MNAESFVDTNVLVYAVAPEHADDTKRRTALQLIQSEDLGLSTQVLQELWVTVTRNIDEPLSPRGAFELLEEFRTFPTAHVDFPLITSAIEHSLRYRIHYWDAAIVAAAERLQATTLYTEDLSHGQHYGSVQVINPFAEI